MLNWPGMVRAAHFGTLVGRFGRRHCLVLSVALALGCAAGGRGAADTAGADANVHDPAAPQSNGAGSQNGQSSGAASSNAATSRLDAAAECPWLASARSLFHVLDRDANNNTWLWGVSYTGPAKVGDLIGTRRIITFDDPAMMGRQLEIESTSDVVRSLKMGQTLWVALEGPEERFVPSRSYEVFRESEGGPLLFASYTVNPATAPAIAPPVPDLLGFTVSIADGCSAPVSPEMAACFADEVRTRLVVTAHADEDVDLEPDRIDRIDVGGEPYNFLLISAERHSGGQSHCPDAVPGTFLAFQVIAAEP